MKKADTMAKVYDPAGVEEFIEIGKKKDTLKEKQILRKSLLQL